MRMNSDELRDQMEADELADASKLTPREYAKLHHLQPQIVYYHLRNGHLESEQCACGRRVLDVRRADAFFKERAAKERTRQGLATTSTE